MAYKTANGIVQSYERMGGSRYAEWRLPNGVVSVENFTNDVKGDEGPSAIFNMVVGDANALGEADKRTGTDVPWNDKAICERNDAPYLATLRTKLLADGWWFNDAEAFMEAAKAVGHADNADTADEVFYVARMLSATKDNWDEVQRAITARDCLAPAIKVASKGVAAPYDTVSSIEKGFNWIIAPAAPSGDGALFVDPAGAALEVHRFDSMVHTPVHAKCVLEKLAFYSDKPVSNFAEVFGFDEFWRTEKVPPATWKRTWGLVSKARFAKELYMSLARARATLVNTNADAAPNTSPTPNGAPSASSTLSEASTNPSASAGPAAVVAQDKVGTTTAPVGPPDMAAIDRLVRELGALATNCARRESAGDVTVTIVINPKGSIDVYGVALGNPAASAQKTEQCVRRAFASKSVPTFTGDGLPREVFAPATPTVAAAPSSNP
jgi:hypothetical protein